MAKDGVSFAGDGSKEVSDKMPESMNQSAMGSSGGPVTGGPDSNKGAQAPSESIKQTFGEMPKDGPIKFAGDN